MRLIDANALMEAFRTYMVENHDREKCVSEENCNACERGCLWRKIVVKAPTIDPESLRPQGEWIDNHCTACGETPLGEELWEHIDGEPPRFERCIDYCPCCGAKMKGGTP